MPPGNRESEAHDADDLGSAEAAEAAAAAAEARAEAARARANELRRKLEASREASEETVEETSDETSEADNGETADDEPPVPAVAETPPAPRKKRSWAKIVATAAAAVAIIGLLGSTGYMVWKHREAEAQRHRTAEFTAAARQGVVNLMSMDYNQAKESVQRVIDDSTGKFKSNFEDGADDLIKAMTDAKVVTKVTVNDAAVESMDKDSATVLVAATSQRTGPEAPKEDQQPRVWRVVVSLQRDGDQMKVSDLEFA